MSAAPTPRPMAPTVVRNEADANPDSAGRTALADEIRAAMTPLPCVVSLAYDATEILIAPRRKPKLINAVCEATEEVIRAAPVTAPLVVTAVRAEKDRVADNVAFKDAAARAAFVAAIRDADDTFPEKPTLAATVPENLLPPETTPVATVRMPEDEAIRTAMMPAPIAANLADD